MFKTLRKPFTKQIECQCLHCMLPCMLSSPPFYGVLNSPMGNSPSGRTIKVTTHHSRLIDEACNNQQTTIELICDNLFAVNMFAVVTAYKSFSLHDT